MHVATLMWDPIAVSAMAKLMFAKLTNNWARDFRSVSGMQASLWSYRLILPEPHNLAAQRKLRGQATR